MHIFLIRHGETEHNIAGLLAGVSDSRLTNHGVLQTQRLGINLVEHRGLRFTNVYSSDLQRAYMTANEICQAQNKIKDAQQVEVVKLEVLREQDFGSLELVPWSSRKAQDALDPRVPRSDDPAFVPAETTDSMRSRADTFLNDYIVPLLVFDHEEPVTVAVVSHGLFLSRLWKSLIAKFTAHSITIEPDVAAATSSHPLDHMSWSNTGYLELEIQIPSQEVHPAIAIPTSTILNRDDTSPFSTASMTVKSVNDTHHLLNLKRARGGIGSAAHDQRQQKLTSFLTKPRVNPVNTSQVSKPLAPSVTASIESTKLTADSYDFKDKKG